MTEYKAGDRIDLEEFGFLHLTEETAEKLNNGKPISLNPFEAPVIHRKADGPRVHVDKKLPPVEISTNGAIDPKKLVEEIGKRTGAPRYNYAPRATDLHASEYDIVSRPSHYAEGRKYEPKDVIRDWELNFNLGSTVKYISRAGRKDAKLKDLQKARQFLDFEIEALEEAKDD